MRVVHRFQVVDIDEGERERHPGASGALDLALDLSAARPCAGSTPVSWSIPASLRSCRAWRRSSAAAARKAAAVSRSVGSARSGHSLPLHGRLPLFARASSARRNTSPSSASRSVRSFAARTASRSSAIWSRSAATCTRSSSRLVPYRCPDQALGGCPMAHLPVQFVLNRVASPCEFTIRNLLILSGCCLVAVARGLIAVALCLIAVARRLIAVAQRLLVIGDGPCWSTSSSTATRCFPLRPDLIATPSVSGRLPSLGPTLL